MSVEKKTIAGKPQYRARVSYKQDGEYKKLSSKWYDRKTDAKAEEARMQAEVQTMYQATGKTFSIMYHEWNDDNRKNITNKTYTENLSMYKLYLYPLGDLRMQDIKTSNIKALFESESFEHLGSSRLNRLRGVIGSTFRYAQRMYDFPVNPIDGFPTYPKTPAEKRKARERKIYTPDEIKALLGGFDAKHAEIRDLIFVVYMTGARINEMLSCKFSHWDGKGLNLTEQKTRLDGWKELKANSHRYITLDKRSNQIIRQQQEMYRQATGYSDDWFIFGGPVKLSYTTVLNHYKAAEKNAGLEESRIHDLRHGHASILLANDQSSEGIMKVSKRLGHSSITTTMEIYAHLLKRDETDIVDVLDSLF